MLGASHRVSVFRFVKKIQKTPNLLPVDVVFGCRRGYRSCRSQVGNGRKTYRCVTVADDQASPNPFLTLTFFHPKQPGLAVFSGIESGLYDSGKVRTRC